MEEELERALAAAGVSRAQLGSDGVSFTVDEDEITLSLGDAEEIVCASVEDAIERIQAHADETDADPEERGAIVELTAWLQAIVADEDSVIDVSRSHLPQLLTEASHLELIHHETLSYLATAGHEVEMKPVGTELAFFEDDNGLFWSIYVSDGETIAYRELSLGD